MHDGHDHFQNHKYVNTMDIPPLLYLPISLLIVQSLNVQGWKSENGSSWILSKALKMAYSLSHLSY